MFLISIYFPVMIRGISDIHAFFFKKNNDNNNVWVIRCSCLELMICTILSLIDILIFDKGAPKVISIQSYGIILFCKIKLVSLLTALSMHSATLVSLWQRYPCILWNSLLADDYLSKTFQMVNLYLLLFCFYLIGY